MDENDVKNMLTLCAFSQNLENLKISGALVTNFRRIFKLEG